MHTAAKKPRGPKAQKLPDSFTAGTTITDLRKKEWVLGREIGQGGFGLIYLGMTCHVLFNVNI